MIETQIDPPSQGCGPAALALAASSLIVAALIALRMEALVLYPFVLMVTWAIVAVLAPPIFLLIRVTRRGNWLTIGTGGFVTGAFFPALLVLLGPAADQASIGDTATIIDGRYTTAGWVENLVLVGEFGLVGIIGALIAWCLFAWISNGEPNRARVRRSVALGALVVVGAVTAALVPWAMRDRSCHNPMRDGRTSIGTVAEFRLHVGLAEWPSVHAELERFSQMAGWSLRADVRPDANFPWFQASLCREPGTEFLANAVLVDGGYIAIDVYQPQGGDSWRQPFRQLEMQLARRWPNTISYPTASDGAPSPPWAPKPEAQRRPTPPAPSSAAR